MKQGSKQTRSVCVNSSRSPGLGSGCTQPVMGGSGSICLPTSRTSLAKSDGEAGGLPMQMNHCDYCSRVAPHALALGSSGHVKTDSPVPAQPANTAFQSDSLGICQT